MRPPYIGPLYLSLLSWPHGMASGVLDLTIGVDICQARFWGRSAGWFDRDLFAAWLACRWGQSFEVDDIAWLPDARDTFVVLFGAAHRVAPDDAVVLHDALVGPNHAITTPMPHVKSEMLS